MKVMAQIQDSATVDARNRDNARRQANASTSDDPQQFDGVLSDVKSDTHSSPVQPVPAKATPADAQTKAAPDIASMEALLQLLGKGTTTGSQAIARNADPAATAKDAKSKAAGASAPADAATEDALQKIAAKDAAAAADATSPPIANTSGQAPTDLASLLILGAAAASPVATGSSQEGAAAKRNSAAAVPGARAMPLDGTDHADQQEVIVSDISIETHLAPAAPNSGAGLADAHHKTSKQDLPTTGGDTPQPGTTKSDAAKLDAAKPDLDRSGLDRSDLGVSLDGAMQITGVLSAPVRSIANTLVELASRPEATAASTTASTPQLDQSKATLGVARTMTLQMNPANLGTVDIRMHMTGQTLDVQLTVSDPRTLGMVNRERDALANALGDQSYALNSLVIQDGGAAASSGGNNAASQGDTSGSHARSDRQNGGFGSDGQDGSNRSSGQGSNRNRSEEQALQSEAKARTGTAVRSGSLFV